MKTRISALALIGFLLASAFPLAPRSAAEEELPCYRGHLETSGAEYEICLDPATWNGGLLMYAHGYVNPDVPLGLPEDQVSVGGVDAREEVLALGYAFAWTGYSKNGYAVREGIADTFALYDLFVQDNGEPEHTYIAGASEGGLITVGLLEQDEGGIFDGGLAACGAIGGWQAAVDYIAGFRVVFDYFFNRDGQVLDFGPLEGLAEEEDRDLGTIWNEDYGDKVRDAIEADLARGGLKTLQLLSVTDAPFDLKNAAETAFQALHFSVGVRDLLVTAGGNPYDNQDTRYRGSFGDWWLNRWVTRAGYRFTADPTAREFLRGHYEPTGELRPDVPLVTLHNLWDPQTPYWHEGHYKRMAWQAGTRSQLLTLPVFRYGHCQFTREEVLLAFAALVLKVEGRVPRIDGLEGLQVPTFDQVSLDTAGVEDGPAPWSRQRPPVCIQTSAQTAPLEGPAIGGSGCDPGIDGAQAIDSLQLWEPEKP